MVLVWDQAAQGVGVRHIENARSDSQNHIVLYALSMFSSRQKNCCILVKAERLFVESLARHSELVRLPDDYDCFTGMGGHKAFAPAHKITL